MALEATFHQLYTCLLELRQVCLHLSTTVREDKPLDGDVVLVDLFGDGADDLLGLLDEALAAAQDGHAAAGYPLDLARARKALAACQECCLRFGVRYWGDLVRYERLRELRRFGRRRRGEWRAWATGVKAALEACEEPLWTVERAIFGCWQELVERIGTSSVWVCNTSIGQRIRLPEPEQTP